MATVTLKRVPLLGIAIVGSTQVKRWMLFVGKIAEVLITWCTPKEVIHGRLQAISCALHCDTICASPFVREEKK